MQYDLVMQFLSTKTDNSNVQKYRYATSNRTSLPHESSGVGCCLVLAEAYRLLSALLRNYSDLSHTVKCNKGITWNTVMKC